MRARIFLFQAAVTDEAARAFAAQLIRAGAESSPLLANGRLAGFSVQLDDQTASSLAKRPEIAQVLDAVETRPLVARRGETTRVVDVVLGGGRDRVSIGGERAVVIAGPCAVESETQLEACARAIAGCGGRLLRGGAYKPRTSPYAFAGSGLEALKLLRAVADRHRLAVVTEVLDPRDVVRVAEYADVLQIGARTMSAFALLREVGAAGRPVLLKRSPSATLDELLHAAEHLMHAGAHDVILCERGVRGFDPAARNLLDLAAVPLLRLRTDLPIVVDPSHGVGVRKAVVPMAAAAIAAGADGVMIECHPDPGIARSDGVQALPLTALARLFAQVDAIGDAVRPSMDAAAE